MCEMNDSLFCYEVLPCDEYDFIGHSYEMLNEAPSFDNPLVEYGCECPICRRFAQFGYGVDPFDIEETLEKDGWTNLCPGCEDVYYMKCCPECYASRYCTDCLAEKAKKDLNCLKPKI